MNHLKSNMAITQEKMNKEVTHKFETMTDYTAIDKKDQTNFREQKSTFLVFCKNVKATSQLSTGHFRAL